jgi:mannose-6-phosphate isomerase class I
MYLDLDKETALTVFDYSYNKERVLKECRKTPTVISNENNCIKSSVISKKDTPCFSLERYEINNGKTEKLAAPVIYVVTDGKGVLTNGSLQTEIKKGDYFFMPYSCNKEYFVESSGNLTLASCIPPERD